MSNEVIQIAAAEQAVAHDAAKMLSVGLDTEWSEATREIEQLPVARDSAEPALDAAIADVMSWPVAELLETANKYARKGYFEGRARSEAQRLCAHAVSGFLHPDEHKALARLVARCDQGLGAES